MKDTPLHQHLTQEVAHIVKEMQQAGYSWSDIVETLQALVMEQMWHLQGFLSWWFM